MRSTIHLGTLLLAVGLAGTAMAQNAPSKQVQDLLKRAEKAEKEGSTAHVHAETFYEEALALAPEDVQLNMRMGLCQLNGPHRHNALPYFLKAASIDPSAPRLQFLLGFALQLHARWDEAIAAYQKHKATFNFQDPDPLYSSTDKRIAECKNGKALTAAPGRATVTNMGGSVNTPQADYGALVSADGATLYFTSRRPVAADSKVNKVTGDFFEDVYMSRAVEGGWSQAERLPAPVNSDGNDASVGLFNDGRTMLIYRDHDGSGDLYTSERRGKVWGQPALIGPTVNTEAHESSGWYSFDRQWLYFVSDRPDDNVGGQDIYRSRWDAATNQWGAAENLGPVVNSIHDEDGVFVHPDGKTLYFSSQGHTSMGGYDVFRTRLVDGAWTKPENLGWPVNSPDDDLFFALTADGTEGYFSSYREGGFGEDDIYRVSFLPEAPTGEATAGAKGIAVVAPEPSSVLVRGRIMSLKFMDGMEADIELIDLEDASLVARFKSDPVTGEYMVAVPAGRKYAMYVKADGYLLRSENVEVPNGERGMERELDVKLESIATGNLATMKNLFFTTASAELQPASLAELNQLKALLEQRPSLRLEISGHTDSDGPSELNRTLSEARAKAVLDHLVSQGIAADRLVAVGFGDTKPVANNDSDANKALNRRTEIKVL